MLMLGAFVPRYVGQVLKPNKGRAPGKLNWQLLRGSWPNTGPLAYVDDQVNERRFPSEAN
jgi:hypothetical protein